MKKYEKPVLMAFSLNGNEILCSGCGDGYPLKGTDMGETMAGSWGVDKGANGIYDNSDFSHVFVQGEDCLTNVPFEGFCKFTVTDFTILWS